jgi:hypothetical protein
MEQRQRVKNTFDNDDSSIEGSNDSQEDLELLDDLFFDDLDADHAVDTAAAAATTVDVHRYQVFNTGNVKGNHENLQKLEQNHDNSLDSKYHVSSDYILGTLIVRVIAARDLKPPRRGHLLNSPQVGVVVGGGGSGVISGGGKSSISSSSSSTSMMMMGNTHGGTTGTRRRRIIFHRTPSFTFASVTFGNEIKQTSCVEETVNPTWTRAEQSLLFDVSLPLGNLAQNSSGSSLSSGVRRVPCLARALVKISLFYSDHGGGTSFMGKKKKVDNHEQKNHDDFIGFASLDVTSVITGKLSYIDKWLPLGGLEDASGNVRVIVEYDCAETHPRVGDKVRFHGFVESVLCPLPKSQVFRVEHVMGDEVILSFITPAENWKCTFQAHRFMLISVERHVSALERYQEELMNLTFKLANSPAADIVSETVRSLPEEGILFVGMQAAFGGLSLLERWREKGLSTAVEDFVHVTNLDGHHTSDNYDDMNLELPSEEDDSVSSHDDISSLDRSEDVDVDADADESLESGMPCCPITGQPMRRPVVAADGNTYEKSAIRRWLRSSDMSPLTGMKLKHKELIPNYLLISSFQSWRRRTDDQQISQI